MSRERNQDEVLARQVARKIRLENRLKPDLTRFFKQVSSDAAASWIASRRIPTLDSFSIELISLLRAHYRRVAKAFGGELRRDVKSFHLSLEAKQDEEETIDAQIVGYINRHSTQQSAFILQTTERELSNIAATTIASATLGAVTLTNAQIAKQIKTDFNTRSAGRIDTIAMTETQTPAEEIKLIEAVTVGAALRRTTGQTILKTWNTVLDEKTRASHVAADRQEVNINTPYTVQGERLPVPGSTLLGASLSNIINCRCTSIARVVGSPIPSISGF